MKRALIFLLALTASCAIAQTAVTSVTLTWTPPTANTDGSTIASGALTYNLYQGPKAGPFTKVASALTAGTTTVTSLTAGNCFAVTAVETQGSSSTSSVESALSGTTCALQPEAPGGLSVAVTITVH